MPCYHPLKAYQTAGKNGKCKIAFKSSGGSTPISLPCGQCVGCRLERSRQWAIRCHHEALQYQNNSFVTLTYNNENLPWDHSLNKKHHQDFIKRLRKDNEAIQIRYYHCGEYGQATPDNDFIARPHYHTLLFNYKPKDLVHHNTENGFDTYNSDYLDNIWGKGNTIVGDVTFQSAAYCARYIMKKVNGAAQEEHYIRTDFTTGEIIKIQPEYNTMSRGRKGIGKGGIGADWLHLYKEDVFRDDFIIHEGNRMFPPKYYDRVLEIEDPQKYEINKKIRQEKLSKHKKDLTPERLHTREVVKLAQISNLKRSI